MPGTMTIAFIDAYGLISDNVVALLRCMVLEEGRGLAGCAELSRSRWRLLGTMTTALDV